MTDRHRTARVLAGCVFAAGFAGFVGIRVAATLAVRSDLLERLRTDPYGWLTLPPSRHAVAAVFDWGLRYAGLALAGVLLAHKGRRLYALPVAALVVLPSIGIMFRNGDLSFEQGMIGTVVGLDWYSGFLGTCVDAVLVLAPAFVVSRSYRAEPAPVTRERILAAALCATVAAAAFFAGPLRENGWGPGADATTFAVMFAFGAGLGPARRRAWALVAVPVLAMGSSMLFVEPLFGPDYPGFGATVADTLRMWWPAALGMSAAAICGALTMPAAAGLGRLHERRRPVAAT